MCIQSVSKYVSLGDTVTCQLSTVANGRNTRLVIRSQYVISGVSSMLSQNLNISVLDSLLPLSDAHGPILHNNRLQY